MTKITMLPPEAVEALRAMGVDTINARRVVIDIEQGCVPVVYVENWTDSRIVDLLRVLAREGDVRVDRTGA